MTNALVTRAEETKTLADRMGRVVPGADAIPPEVRLGVANLALIHGLDPFLGEVMAIRTKRGWVPYVGIDGTRRAARNQVSYQRVLVPLNDAWAQEYYKMTAQEIRTANHMHDEDIVWLCAVYVEGYERPFVELGACGPGFPTVSRAPAWKMSKKRAEAAALKAACDLPFAIGGGAEGVNGESDQVIEGEVTVTVPAGVLDDPVRDDTARLKPLSAEAQAASEAARERIETTGSSGPTREDFVARVLAEIEYYEHPGHALNTMHLIGRQWEAGAEEAILADLLLYAEATGNNGLDEDDQDGQAALPIPA